MRRDTELLQRRNAAIKKDYDRLRKGPPKRYSEHVVQLLSEKYFLSPRTIEVILWAKEKGADRVTPSLPQAGQAR